MTVALNLFLQFMCLLNLIDLNGKCAKSHLNYKGLYSQEISNYEVIVPHRVDEEGKFISGLIPHHYNKRSSKTSKFIFYKFPIAGEECIIQLKPNLKFVSPGAVIEVHGKSSKSQKNYALNRKFENLEISRLKNADCHYSGFLRGDSTSKVALSTCFGLAGFLQTRNGTYTIEPIAGYDRLSEEEHPHILYKNDDESHNFTVCSTLDFQRNRTVREAKSNGNGNFTSALNPLYIETLIAIDKTLLSDDEDFDFENYILTIFNMAFSLFHDASLGFLINLSLARIIRLETDEDGMNMNVNQDAVKTLENFQEWQYNINPGDDTHPNHHDVAILITRINMYSNLSYGFLGVSTLGSACDKKQSAIVCKDNGLRLGFIIAHGIAHLLGAEHDGFNNSCIGLDGEGYRAVMHPQVLLTTETWSRCTQGYIKTFLESGFGNCLYDEPFEHNFNIHDSLPGTIYDADFQCRQIMAAPTARECSEGSTCSSLNCEIPGSFCVITNVPPATGTSCGENMWCRHEKCLMVGERPDAIDGDWGEWSPWSECSRTCGSGVSRSERLCNRPIPSRGGRYCLGKSKRHRICSSKPCDMSQPSFRDLQCGEFDDWIYPEDGKKHTWKEYLYHDGNPCILFCINENLEVVALKPRVLDGTNCHKGIRDVCVDGICMDIPCDLNLESNAIEDVCGVCHGDGTSCDFSQGQQSMEKLPKVMTKLIAAPIGTRNIKVEEMMPSAAKILVRDVETNEFYIRGNNLGMYHVPGSQAWLGMLKSRQEALNIPGPLTRALTIWIERVENVTVKWSMALPMTQQRKPEFTWDYVRWSSCSAVCGPGTQKSEPNCVEEKAGLVENSYCADLEVPPVKTRFCEIRRCEPRWMVADWKDCTNVSSSKSVKRRMVRCVKTYGEGEGELDIVSDEECPLSKPKEEEPCDMRYKRDNSKDIASRFFEKYNDPSMFSSKRIKIGFHKKYDEYLKNFNAIATPQRKSETIPLHIVDTPHFRNYYKVLKSVNFPTESNNRIDSEKLNFANGGMKTKVNGLLPRIYKNTFSLNQPNFNGQKSDISKLFGKKTMKKLFGRKCRRRFGDQRKRYKFFLPIRCHGVNYRKGRNKNHGRIRAAVLPNCKAISNDKSVIKRNPSSIKQRLRYPGWKLNADREVYSNSQESDSENIIEKPIDNYTIRFGQVLIDKDEGLDLEIIFEERDKDDLIGIDGLHSDRGKVWKIKGEEAIQFMGNITAIDYSNKTASDD